MRYPCLTNGVRKEEGGGKGQLLGDGRRTGMVQLVDLELRCWGLNYQSESDLGPSASATRNRRC